MVSLLVISFRYTDKEYFPQRKSIEFTAIVQDIHFYWNVLYSMWFVDCTMYIGTNLQADRVKCLVIIVITLEQLTFKELFVLLPHTHAQGAKLVCHLISTTKITKLSIKAIPKCTKVVKKQLSLFLLLNTRHSPRVCDCDSPRLLTTPMCWFLVYCKCSNEIIN